MKKDRGWVCVILILGDIIFLYFRKLFIKDREFIGWYEDVRFWIFFGFWFFGDEECVVLFYFYFCGWY